MSKLAQLLSYLERPGVTELVFRSGVPAVMRSANRLHPLTVAPLQISQIRRFFEGTAVSSRLPLHGEIPIRTLPLELLGVSYQVTIGGNESAVEVRIAKDTTKRSSTWTDLPEADEPHDGPTPTPLPPLATNPVPAPMPRTARGPVDPRSVPPAVASHRPPSPAPAPTPAHPADSSSGMLAASPQWTIERNDDHGAALGHSEVSTRRDVASIPLPEPEPLPLPEPPAASIPQPRPRRPDSAPHHGMPVHPRLREILVMARQHGASDVHIMSGNPVRVRRLGALEPMGHPIAPTEVEAMVASLLREGQQAQLDTLGYIDLAADVQGAGRVRINVGRQRTGLKLCFRLVVSDPPSVAALGLPPEVHKLAMHHQGLVIISGPNGHGKTTSMAALVDLFNTGHSMHIITVEDPVEVIHPRKQAIVTQREVGTHTRSFARALAAALREDPDVIAIGELRDRETVEMALSAAETGHLVIATMSTPSGAKTIDRMIDMFPPDDQAQVRATLAGALKLVLSQRLLRRADGHGLVAAFEMISGGIPLWSLIRDNKLYQLPSLLQRGRNFGMIALEDSLRELLGSGVIAREEALNYAEDPKALAPRESNADASSLGTSAAGWRLGRRS